MEVETFTRYADLFGGVFEPLKDQPIDCIKDPKDKINMLTKRIKLFEKHKDYTKFIKILSYKDWLLSKFSSSNKLPYRHNNIVEYFIYLCENGYLEVAQWLYSLGGVNIRGGEDVLFYKVCLKGHLEVAQWLYSLGGVTLDKWHEYTFRYTCWYGHLEVAQWLYSLGGIDIYTYNEGSFGEDTFNFTCWYGYLEIAQWLYSLGGVNIHTRNDILFRCVCKDGNLEIAKWLYSLGGINIHAQDDEVFHDASSKVIDWLNTLEK